MSRCSSSLEEGQRRVQRAWRVYQGASQSWIFDCHTWCDLMDNNNRLSNKHFNCVETNGSSFVPIFLCGHEWSSSITCSTEVILENWVSIITANGLKSMWVFGPFLFVAIGDDGGDMPVVMLMRSENGFEFLGWHEFWWDQAGQNILIDFWDSKTWSAVFHCRLNWPTQEGYRVARDPFRQSHCS